MTSHKQKLPRNRSEPWNYFLWWKDSDRGQSGPGLVTGGEEGEASGSLDLLLQLGSFRVYLGGGGSDHGQGGVDVDQRQRCRNQRGANTASELQEPHLISEQERWRAAGRCGGPTSRTALLSRDLLITRTALVRNHPVETGWLAAICSSHLNHFMWS